MYALRICLQSFSYRVIIPVQIKAVAVADTVPEDHERLREEEQASVPEEAGLYEFFVPFEVTY